MVMNNQTEFNTVAERHIYTVSQLNREVRTALEGFPLIWIEAELSNFSRPASGHWYFSLKDEAAQVRCAMFRGKNQLVRLTPKNGDQVLVRARIGLYEPRGDYQLIIEHMEEAGDGALRRAFEELKTRLEKLGWFDSANKKPIPTHVKRIGIVTSATGAAIHDILTTLKRRFPMQSIILYPVLVQGKDAAADIAEKINKANQRNECDVLIVARGGGSLEDLWAFNEEVVAKSIHESKLPIVTGIGHEVDFTIADFVADQRAATPTAAAELISPDRIQYIQRLNILEQKLKTDIRRQLQQQQQKLDWLNKRLRQPGEIIRQLYSRFETLKDRQQRAINQLIRNMQYLTATLESRLKLTNPKLHVDILSARNIELSNRMQRAISHQLINKKKQLQYATHTLETVSPLKTLNRGYAIVTNMNDKVIRSIDELNTGDTIQTKIAHGKIISEIKEKHND